MVKFNVLVFLVVLINFSSSIAQSQFVGTFSNEQFSIEFKPSQQQKLTGNVIASEGSFPLVANIANNYSINGSYNYYGQNIPFTGILQQNKLIINSEGQQFVLNKTNSNGKNNVAQIGGGLQKEAAWGIAYQMPSGWSTQVSGGVRFFVSPDQKKIIMLTSDTESTTLQDLHNGAKEGIIDGNTRLLPTGNSNNFGNDGVAVALSGTFNGRQAKGYALGRLSPFRSGAIVVGVSETADYSTEFQQQIVQFTKQIQFFAPKRATNSDGSISDWGTYMKGRKLVYMKSDTGFYMKISIYLCSDGSFKYTDNSGGFGGGASIAGNAGYTGKWQAHGSGNSGTLVLNYNDGSTKTYNTQLRKDGLYLNGTRYLRDTNDLCN